MKKEYKPLTRLDCIKMDILIFIGIHARNIFRKCQDVLLTKFSIGFRFPD